MHDELRRSSLRAGGRCAGGCVCDCSHFAGGVVRGCAGEDVSMLSVYMNV